MSIAWLSCFILILERQYRILNFLKGALTTGVVGSILCLSWGWLQYAFTYLFLQCCMLKDLLCSVLVPESPQAQYSPLMEWNGPSTSVLSVFKWAWYFFFPISICTVVFSGLPSGYLKKMVLFFLSNIDWRLRTINLLNKWFILASGLWTH